MFLEALRNEEHGIVINDILATGGGSRSDLWLQIKADMLGRPVRRARYRESGTAGAAIAAGLAIGIYETVEQGVEAFKGAEKDFVSNNAHAELYKRLQKRYQEVVEKILL